MDEQGVSDTAETVRDESANKQETIAYDTHKKLLNQRKADQERMKAMEQQLNEYKLAQKSIEEQKMVEQGKYKELVQEREKELEAIRQENLSYKKSFDKAIKISAFREKLGGIIENSAYYDFVNVDAIIIEPETGMVDMASVDAAVNQFKKEHPRLYTPKTSRTLPTDAPANTILQHSPKNKTEFANALKDELLKQFK